ncbi:MAG: hypothetical protein NTW72_07185 [Gemmatimonadetes bacterium]|nr:hypothetical protein [Gemmatimonadota bacterium]
METNLMWTTAGAMLCVRDDRGTLVGWIPFPRAADALGPGREKVYLARAVEIPVVSTSRAA